MVVHNMDIAGLVRRIRRHKQEIHKCNSHGLMHTTDHDKDRIFSYLESLIIYFDWMVAQPQQDFVEWHPTEIELGEPEVLEAIENEALMDLIQMYDALEYEMAHCQSAQMHTSMISHDERRFREITEKMEDFINNYINPITPLDMPESSPKRQSAGKGQVTRAARK